MAWSLLVHTGKGATANNVVTTTAIDTTGATLIVVVVGYAPGGGTSTVSQFLTDSASNTNYYYSANQGTSTDSVGIAWIVNPTTSATHTFTIGTQANLFPSICVLAFSGSFGGAEKNTRAQSTTSTTVLPGSITPSFDNTVLVTGYTNSTSTGTPTYSINASFTVTDQVTGAAIPTSLAAAYLIQTSAAAANPTWTTSGANTTNEATMVSFLLRAASAAATPFAGSVQ